MRLALLTAAFAVGTLMADDKGGADKAREKFQGTWTIVAMTRGGKKAESPGAATVVFEGGKYRIKAGDTLVEEGTFSVDASKTPHQIDVTATSGDDKGTKWHGVYELKGDTLRAVVGPVDKDRPTKLGEPGPGTRSFDVKRETKSTKP